MVLWSVETDVPFYTFSVQFSEKVWCCQRWAEFPFGYNCLLTVRGSIPNNCDCLSPVSYTHLDVYKRQSERFLPVHFARQHAIHILYIDGVKCVPHTEAQRVTPESAPVLSNFATRPDDLPSMCKSCTAGIFSRPAHQRVLLFQWPRCKPLFSFLSLCVYPVCVVQ